MEEPVVVYDKERDGGVDKGKPMTDGPTQPRPQSLEDEEDDVSIDKVGLVVAYP
jgi:hypothetical protein